MRAVREVRRLTKLKNGSGNQKLEKSIPAIFAMEIAKPTSLMMVPVA